LEPIPTIPAGVQGLWFWAIGTTIEITLPDALAQEAKGAGPVSPEAIADLLRRKLASDRLARLQQVRELLTARPEEAMTRQEINAEIKAYRQEQRIAAGS
jgi:hypothetical protein